MASSNGIVYLLQVELSQRLEKVYYMTGKECDRRGIQTEAFEPDFGDQSVVNGVELAERIPVPRIKPASFSNANLHTVTLAFLNDELARVITSCFRRGS
jgi:hypothetical protein